MRTKVQALVNSNLFNNFIILIVLLDLALMGLEEFYSSSLLTIVQQIIIGIYIGELALRWIGKESKKSYKKDKRNLFDLAIIALKIIPEMGPLAIMKLYRSTIVVRYYEKVTREIESVINSFYLSRVRVLS